MNNDTDCNHTIQITCHKTGNRFTWLPFLNQKRCRFSSEYLNQTIIVKKQEGHRTHCLMTKRISQNGLSCKSAPSSGDNTHCLSLNVPSTSLIEINQSLNWFLRPYGLNASEVITDTSYDECEALHQEQGIEWYFCSWHFYKQLKQSAEFHDLVLQENQVSFISSGYSGVQYTQ